MFLCHSLEGTPVLVPVVHTRCKSFKLETIYSDNAKLFTVVLSQTAIDMERRVKICDFPLLFCIKLMLNCACSYKLLLIL